MELSNEDRRGLQRAGAAASEYNATMFAVEEVLNSDMNTAWVGVVDSVQTGSGESSGVANVTPLVAHTDADGQSLPMSSIPALPYTRVQYGIAALIIEPVPGDRVACVSCKDDISNVGPGVTRPQRPGSYRKFDQSDSISLFSMRMFTPTHHSGLRARVIAQVDFLAPWRPTRTTDMSALIGSSAVALP